MATENGVTRQTDKTFLYAAILIAVGVMATTLAQIQLLGLIPLKNLLKNELHADRATAAAFFFWAQMAWYFKPVCGIVTDAFPLFGSRRKSYLLISSSLTVVMWFALSVTPHRYATLLVVAIAINVFAVLASTVVGGYMVEVAQRISGSGRLSAIRNFVQQTCYIVSGSLAGFLGSIAFGWTGVACGGIMFLLLPATLLFLKEEKRHTESQVLLSNARAQLGVIVKARTMWAAAGLMALFYLAPGLATATFYRQQNELHMGTEAQGLLQTLAGIGGVSAACLYILACRRWNLKTLLLWCVSIAGLTSLGYLFYTTPLRADVVETVYGFGFVMAEMALMDLAVRATPPGSEGLGFSLMMSVRNLALFGSDWFGSKMLDRFHWTFSGLVLGNAATTFIVVPLVFLLPLLIVGRKDAEPATEAAAPRIAAE
jgi:hypothetical protein